MFKNIILKITYFFMITFICLAKVSANTIEANFVYVGDEGSSALLGVKQGLKEANLQGQFLNQKYNLDVISSAKVTEHDFSGYIAILTAVDINTYKALTSTHPDMPVFNLSINDDDLRAECINNALHTIPSLRMKSDAEKQWKKKETDSDARAQAWHHDFKKFAARDLNKRFKKNHKIEMDDYAWAGWAAVKMTSDTVARTNIVNTSEMLNYLKQDLVFDGQKGSNMNFRETGQLRQLMLLIENNKIVAEAPVRGVAKPPTLDSLGTLSCEK